MKQIKHIAILYLIKEHQNDIKEDIEITEINELSESQLSNIALIDLQKLNYNI